MLYQVTMKCYVCGAVEPYSVEREEELAAVLREAVETCPRCGALMSPQVTGQVREAEGV